jgi:acyl carrier protein
MSYRTPIAEQVASLVAQAAQGKIGPEAITPELSLRRDLGLDSLGLSTLLLRLGEELGTDPDAFIEMLLESPVNTVADMMALGERVKAGA